MRDDPLTPACVLQALELFAPQARPYNCDDHFDCWGLVQRVFDWFDEGYDVNEQLPDASTAGGRPGAGPAAAVATGCRVELWEETADLWTHRPSREDHDEPLEWFDLPERLLHADSRFAVVVYARGAGGFSADAMTPFLYSSLGIAAALQLAGLADHVDLDGALLLADDPFTGIAVRGDVLAASDEPGLGVHPRG